MQKTILLILALGAQAVYGHTLYVTNNAGITIDLWVDPGKRVCYCLKNTQSKRLSGLDAGNVKLFGSTDCTGNYSTMSSNGVVNSAYWVNSVSFGKAGIRSTGPNGCPNRFPAPIR